MGFPQQLEFDDCHSYADTESGVSKVYRCLIGGEPMAARDPIEYHGGGG